MSKFDKPKSAESYREAADKKEANLSFDQQAELKKETEAVFKVAGRDPEQPQKVYDPEAERITKSLKARKGIELAIKDGNFDAIVKGVKELDVQGRVSDIDNIINALGALGSKEQNPEKYKGILDTLERIRALGAGKEYFENADRALAQARGVN